MTREHARPLGPPPRARRARPGAAAATRRSVGDRLGRARQGASTSCGRSVTKIRARYLAALERGDYREVPGAVYTKGFLRNYAIYLNLDPEDVLRLSRERGEVPSSLRSSCRGRPPRAAGSSRPGLPSRPRRAGGPRDHLLLVPAASLLRAAAAP
jgi:hypothetical protein